ncbi:MAG: hypothetical protein WCA38_03310 [Candidatus Acidiferrales bacterium]
MVTISLYREVYEVHPNQRQFPICSPAEALGHALSDRSLPLSFLEQKSTNSTVSDPHALLMLEAQYLAAAVDVSGRAHTRYRDYFHDGNHTGLTFVPPERLLFQLLTQELRNSRKIYECMISQRELATTPTPVVGFFLGEAQRAK